MIDQSLDFKIEKLMDEISEIKSDLPVVFSLMIFDEMNGYKHAEKFLKEIVKDLGIQIN